MTEVSYLWTTSGTPSGDQVSGYTQAHWSTIMDILAACSGFEGVAPGYANELACSDGGANTVDVATGGALVDGKPYESDAVENVNIPSAVGAGNTRIDRIVLRASWASFTVRITRIAGTDAASPSAPAITQTPGTTYDIQLCQVLVDTSGNVTVTDERTFAAADTTSLADLAVTTAKLDTDAVTGAKIADDQIDSEHYVDGSIDTAHLANDAVDDTKVGNRVPQFYRRQGGDASDWSVAGSTNRTPTTVRMQAGVVEVTIDDGLSSGATVVTFPQAFSNKPIVFTTPTEINKYTSAINPSTTQVAIWASRDGTSGSDTVTINWLAIGPE